MLSKPPLMSLYPAPAAWLASLMAVAQSSQVSMLARPRFAQVAPSVVRRVKHVGGGEAGGDSGATGSVIGVISMALIWVHAGQAAASPAKRRRPSAAETSTWCVNHVIGCPL